MMQRIIYAASALLILQICLAVAFNTGSNNLEMAAPGSPFATFSPDSVSHIDITGDQGKQVILERTNSGWALSNYFSAPADSTLVDELLNKLINAKKGFAVATSEDAAKRFKTAEDDFERHIILKEGQTTVSDFFMGTSAGFRHSHARINGQNEVISIPVSSFEVAADSAEWLDRKLAKRDKLKLKRIDFNDMTLVKNEKEWQVDGLPSDNTNKDELSIFIDKICNLTIQAVADPREVSSLFNDKPALAFAITTDSDTKVNYTLVKKEDYHVLKMTDNDLYFKISSWQIEDLIPFTREKLTLNTPKEQETPSTDKTSEEE